MNSLLMVLPAVLVSTMLGALNGYVLSKWRFRGSETMFAMLLFGVFMPMQVVLLPMSQVLGWLGIANSIWGLVLVHVIAGMPCTTLFFRNYYVGLPDELVKAAMLDGAGFWRIFWRIVLPLSTPIMVVTLIWQFTNIWNDFLYGVVFSGADCKPITVGLNNLANTSSSVKEYNVDMAAAMIAGAAHAVRLRRRRQVLRPRADRRRGQGLTPGRAARFAAHQENPTWARFRSATCGAATAVPTSSRASTSRSRPASS